MEAENIIATKKIKLYPDKEQRKILREWFNTSRYVYNKTIYYCNSKECSSYAKRKLRNLLVTEKHRDGTHNENIRDFELNTPKTIRQQSVFEAAKNFKSAFSNLKNKNIKFFKLKKKSKERDTIGVEQAPQIRDKSIRLFPTFMRNPIRIGRRQKKELSKISLTKDSFIHFNGMNYELLVPYEIKQNQNTKSTKILSLDPGFRTFLTGYDCDGIVCEFHRKDYKVNKIKKKLDIFNSLFSKTKNKPRLLKKSKKLRQKIKNYIDDLHWRTITEILKYYDTVLLPDFENQKVAKKSKNKHLNKDIYLYSHYTFKKRLEYKAKTQNKQIISASEDYTSKTCGNCGSLNYKLQSSKNFKCPLCKVEMDRDYNAARNILIKFLCS